MLQSPGQAPIDASPRQISHKIGSNSCPPHSIRPRSVVAGMLRCVQTNRPLHPSIYAQGLILSINPRRPPRSFASTPLRCFNSVVPVAPSSSETLFLAHCQCMIRALGVTPPAGLFASFDPLMAEGMIDQSEVPSRVEESLTHLSRACRATISLIGTGRVAGPSEVDQPPDWNGRGTDGVSLHNGKCGASNIRAG